jgi:hypothetical protein
MHVGGLLSLDLPKDLYLSACLSFLSVVKRPTDGREPAGVSALVGSRATAQSLTPPPVLLAAMSAAEGRHPRPCQPEGLHLRRGRT